MKKRKQKHLQEYRRRRKAEARLRSHRCQEKEVRVSKKPGNRAAVAPPELKLPNTTQTPPADRKKPKRTIEDMTIMGRRLREFRNDLGWSQERFAQHMRKHGHRCSRSYMDKIEWQIKVPSFKLAKTIRRVMLLRNYKPALLHPRMNLRNEPKHYRRGWKQRWLAEVHAGKRVC